MPKSQNSPKGRTRRVQRRSESLWPRPQARNHSSAAPACWGDAASATERPFLFKSPKSPKGRTRRVQRRSESLWPRPQARNLFILFSIKICKSSNNMHPKVQSAIGKLPVRLRTWSRPAGREILSVEIPCSARTAKPQKTKSGKLANTCAPSGFRFFLYLCGSVKPEDFPGDVVYAEC